MATSYRYLFADLATNAILAELPLTGVNFTQQLNTAGTFTGQLLLSGVNAASLNVLNATLPNKCVIYVDRNGQLIWGGVISSREYNSQSQLLKLTAREFLSYFESRIISQTVSFTAVDQLQIAQQLISNAMGVPYGNIGLLYNQDAGSTNVSGVTVTRTYYNYEMKTVLSAIQDLAKQTQGFDFEISVYYDGSGTPARSFNTYFPKSGDTYSSTSTTIPVFELGGNISVYDYAEDGSKTANTIYATGAGSNESELIATATDSTKFAAGWALLETTTSYSDVTDTTLLSGLATSQVNAVSYPPITLKISAPPYLDPVFGSYELADEARIRIQDPFFPNGYDAIFRIIGLTVTPGENGPEQITLTLTTGTY